MEGFGIDDFRHREAQWREHFEKVISPFQGNIAASGMDPLQATQRLMTIDASLRVGSPQQKAMIVKDIISQFGVDINTLDSVLAGESPCGRSNMRIKGWMGRADQTAKVRGMFIHPEQVDRVVKRHNEIARARLVIDWVDQADQITLRCESDSSDPALPGAIAESIRSICKLRGEVEIVSPGGLPNDGKVIDDIRQYD